MTLQSVKHQKKAGPGTLQHNISIWLDTYDDIFSDFDPRPYRQRALSDDLLTEIRKLCHEKKTGIEEFHLLLPHALRNEEIELVIIKRLEEHFKVNHALYQRELIHARAKGGAFILAGIILILLASYISVKDSKQFYMHLLFVISEPAGWFSIWSGLDIFFFTSRQDKKELGFYSKLSQSQISFHSLEQL